MYNIDNEFRKSKELITLGYKTDYWKLSPGLNSSFFFSSDVKRQNLQLVGIVNLHDFEKHARLIRFSESLNEKSLFFL